LSLFALACLVAPPATGAGCALPEQAGLPEGEVGFVQARHLAGIERPLVSEGVLAIAADAVTWRVETPVEIVTTLDARGMAQSVAGGPAEPLAGAEGMLAEAGFLPLLKGDLAGLGQRYEVEHLADAADGWRLRLTPRSPRLRQQVRAIEVAGCARLSSLTIAQANGDRVDVRFAD
jgi:hypothetical protein